ncbi:hypothetical protein [Streptomyces sp. NPDC048603]|uniref:hypothetical protein n=1 Tax=Streptomyces sp. NPDC048603 TaxID=3365577 RepID=UPI00372330FB
MSEHGFAEFEAGFGRPVAPMPVKPPKPPKQPRQKQPLHTSVTDVLLAVLAVASLGLSGWSLATLLMDAGAPVWVAVLGVGVFDVLALAAGLQVYARRNAPHTAGGARLVMMAALIASSVVNGAHGLALGGWTTAVVLAAAPLSFEICFELRHRTLTALIWVLFRREAALALRRDAWARIAPVVAASDAEVQAPTGVRATADVLHRVHIEREHQDVGAELAALRAELAAVRAERPAIETEARPVSPEQDVDDRLHEALALYRAVTSTPGATEVDRAWAVESVEMAARQGGSDRPADAPSLVKGAAEPEPAPGGDAEDRVPEQRPRSIAGGVAELRAARISDPAVMADRLSVLMGREVTLPSVKREIRRQAAAEREAAGRAAAERQTGQYL